MRVFDTKIGLFSFICASHLLRAGATSGPLPLAGSLPPPPSRLIQFRLPSSRLQLRTGWGWFYWRSRRGETYFSLGRSLITRPALLLLFVLRNLLLAPPAACCPEPSSCPRSVLGRVFILISARTLARNKWPEESSAGRPATSGRSVLHGHREGNKIDHLVHLAPAQSAHNKPDTNSPPPGPPETQPTHAGPVHAPPPGLPAGTQPERPPLADGPGEERGQEQRK